MGEALDADAVGAIEKGIVGAPFGSLIGLECVSVEEDHVQLRLPFRAEVTTVGEMVHGGAIASAVDVAAADGSPVARALVTYRLSLPTEAPA